MRDRKISEKKLAHILMIFLVIAWGFDYVPAKWGLEIMSPLGLLFLKYAIGVMVMIAFLLIKHKRPSIRKKDIPIFFVCALFGEILYFGSEYTAMDYIPVSLLTIILGFVPVLSIVIERVLFKRKQSKTVIFGIIACVAGVILVIGTDFNVIFQGRGIGYLLAFCAVFCWNIYNFITSSIQQYDSVTLSFNQMMCSIILAAPVAIHQMPPAEEFSGLVIAGLLWIGIIDSGFGFLIFVYGLQKLGPTTSALYSDFLPVTTTFFGAIFLKESITLLQVIGGIVVVASAFVVIKEKGKLDAGADERLDEQTLK